MADTKTQVTIIDGSGFTLRERNHSRDTALECARRSLERQAAHIEKQLAALDAGEGRVSVWRGSKELPLRAFTPAGCRWCGTEPGEHGQQNTDFVGPHEYEPPTEEQVKARTHVRVNCFDIELDNGENLKDLGVGNFLEPIRETAGLCPGTWVLVEYHGDFDDEATLRLLTREELIAGRNAEAFAQIYA